MRYLAALFFIFPLLAHGQYPPPAGQEGSTAIHMDSVAIRAWASACSVERGFQGLNQPELGLADYGAPELACGKATGLATDVLSLGDAGMATLQFEKPIRNGPGFDFAVFENSFNDEFLELAFVEVSSDGQHFVRFPAVSLTQTGQQIEGFDVLDATEIHNLAGKYRQGYGTPFDLEVFAALSSVDVNHITHVRIIDVCGSLLDDYASFDSEGRKINDPWPTPFPSSGFDLEAVGIMHVAGESSVQGLDHGVFTVYPVPVKDILNIRAADEHKFESIRVFDRSGACVLRADFNESMNINALPAGLYFLQLMQTDGQVLSRKFLKD